MKNSFRSLFALFLALCLLVGCNAAPSLDSGGDASSSGDAENAPSLGEPEVVYPSKTVEAVLSYDAIAASVVGYGGITARYTVDTASISSLEAAGYTVVYGAVSAFIQQKDSAVSVTGNAKDGYRSTAAASATVVAYATGSPSYASKIVSTDLFSGCATGTLVTEKGGFLFATAYESADAAAYEAELVSLGFVAVTDKNGNQSIVYDQSEESTSMLALAESLVNEYSGDTIEAYYYNQNAALRGVLTACGKEIRTLDAPLTTVQNTDVTLLAKSVVNDYVTAARAAYRTEAYADYKTSVVGNYTTTASKMNDIPTAQCLYWVYRGDEDVTFTVTIATDAAFTKNVRTYKATDTVLEVYNLFVDTTYYFKVMATSRGGYSYESASSTFQTAPSVRWIYVDGVRNVRDIGGWTGLNQGLVYRGSELNQTQSYGTAITEAGVRTMREELGIRTHLDFRPAASNAQFGTSSPIGEGVNWENHPITAFLHAFDPNSNYASAMKVFTDYDNYPIYMNCVGGADRTGTAVFMVEGLCGVEEADLAVDLELTSFSKFGYRYRYNNSTYIYADLVARVKEYDGKTLQEKFETVFREVYGFSEAEISNVQAILTQTGAVYDFKDGDNGNVSEADMVDGKFSFSFVMRGSTAVSSVTVDGVSLDFGFDAASATVTIDGAKLSGVDLAMGIGTITFDDGATLRFYVL